MLVNIQSTQPYGIGINANNSKIYITFHKSLSVFRFPLKFARGCRLVRGNSTHALRPTYTSIKSTSVSIRLACVSLQLNFRLAILKRQQSKYSVPFDFKRLYLPVPPHSFGFVELFGRFQSASEMIRRNAEYVSALAYIQNNPATLPLIGKKYLFLSFLVFVLDCHFLERNLSSASQTRTATAHSYKRQCSKIEN